MVGKRKVALASRPGRKCARTAGTGGGPTETVKCRSDEVGLTEEQSLWASLIASRDEAVKKRLENGATLTKHLSKRFEGKKIEVDNFIDVPRKILFISEDYCTEASNYVLSKQIVDVIPEEYRTKWSSESSPATKCLLHLIKGVMERYTRGLKFQDNTWEHNGDAGSEHAEEDSTDIDFCPKGITEQEMKEKAHRTYIAVESHNMVVKLLNALTNGMVHSKGCEFMRSFLNVASDICFGVSNHIEVMPVGNSTCSLEGFAVSRAGGCSSCQSSVSPGSVSPVPSDLSASSMTSPSQDQLTTSALDSLVLQQAHFTSPSGGPSPCMVPDRQAVPMNQSPSAAEQQFPEKASSQGSFRASDGYIYPDCVVACIDEANFSKYIFVCDINTSHIDKEREFSQLVHEMLGACIEQTEVFGIIMNCNYAIIARMIVNDEHNIIQYGERYYPLEMLHSFNSQLFFKFLCEVIAVLDYGNTHIGQCSHNHLNEQP